MRHAGDAELPNEPIDQCLARLAAEQHGVFTRAQLARLGVTRGVAQRRVAAGRWDQLSRDVFRIAGAATSWRQSLLAACLSWGQGAVASHRSAAALWGLAGFEPGPIEITIPVDRRRQTLGLIHRSALPPAEVSVIDAVPVTNVPRTLIDVASVSDADRVEEALDDALRRRLVSLAWLKWFLARSPRRPGVALIRSLAAHRSHSGIPQSVLETRFLRALCRAGLPEPVLQHQVRDGTRLIAVVDFAYPHYRFGIETDGWRWHSSRAQWEHDVRRANELTFLDWRVMHYTWSELSRPKSVIESVRAALEAARRGWR